jgi:hypothetical protein
MFRAPAAPAFASQANLETGWTWWWRLRGGERGG